METIIFNGKTYRRNPDANHKVGKYYYSSGGGFLHRDIYASVYGEIPEGWVVHHKDGNPHNNDISNLEAMSKIDHLKTHDNDKHLEEIREMAKEWHASEEGHDWHVQHGKEVFGNLKLNDYLCRWCGKPFQSKKIVKEEKLFCTNACKSAWRRDSGVDDEVRNCQVCGRQFKVNKYKKTKTCSNKCTRYFKNA